MDNNLIYNYVDCIQDSPKFRKNVNLAFAKIVDFQDIISEISDSFSQSIKSGMLFTTHYQSFCFKIEKLNKLYADNEYFQNDLNQILKVFVQFKEHFKTLMENFQSVQKDFKLFLEHFKDIETCKKSFQKSSDNLDNSQQKCAAVPKSKSNENVDIDKQCTLAKREFTQSSLAYMTNIEKYEIYKNSLFLRACTGIIASKSNYYSNGNEFMESLQPWLEIIKSSKNKYDKLYDEKLLEVSNVISILSNGTTNHIVENEVKSAIKGYLYKCPKKSWQKWQRRWFKVDNNQLLSCKRTDYCFSVVEEDLRICTAKELLESERRFCFELIGLDHTHILQADDEISQKKWIECFQNGISFQMGTLRKQKRNSTNINNHEILRKHSSQFITKSSQKSANDNKSEDRKCNLLRNVLLVRGNSWCCDCNDDKPRWASSSLGITLCTECSGSHRSLGVHISKVRSMTLDNWEPEMLCVMFMLGNEVVNLIFESDKEAIASAALNGIIKPDSNTDMNSRNLWTKAKWEKKQFVQPNTRKLLTELEQYIRENMTMFSTYVQDSYRFTTTSDLLRHGLEIMCLPVMMLALALNTNVNGDSNEDFIPLHLAASTDFWPGCEFLILNGAKIDIVDKNHQTALHKACQNENVLVVWLLLKRGARQNIRDNKDNEVLQIAMDTANANTVTLLRLQMLNENTKEANLGSSGDETVNDVFRDFTDRAFDQIDEWFASDSGRFHRMNSSKSLNTNVSA